MTHLEAAGATTITVESALAWVQQPAADLSSSVWLRRMTAVRGFARHMSGIDPATEVPPLGLVTFRRSWRQPFIYSETDVLALMSGMPGLVPSPLRAATFQTMIGLLAATGMRIGEVTALSAPTSTGTRALPSCVPPSSTRAGNSHSTRPPSTLSPPTQRCGTDSWSAAQPGLLPVQQRDADLLLRLLGEVPRAGAHLGGWSRFGCPAAVHDLRHSFAVNTLIRWHREDRDVGALLPRLSTYLGHLTPGHTYWYLSAAPELLALAAARLEKRASR